MADLTPESLEDALQLFQAGMERRKFNIRPIAWVPSFVESGGGRWFLLPLPETPPRVEMEPVYAYGEREPR